MQPGLFRLLLAALASRYLPYIVPAGLRRFALFGSCRHPLSPQLGNAGDFGEKLWCERGDSNPHSHTATGP